MRQCDTHSDVSTNIYDKRTEEGCFKWDGGVTMGDKYGKTAVQRKELD